MRSPGRTRSRSPGTTWVTGTSRSPPGRSTRAVGGRSSRRPRTAPAAWPLARASSHRPSRTRPMMTAAESKYVSWPSPAAITVSGRSVTNDGVGVGGQRPDRDERVHVRLAVAGAAGGGDEEPAAEDELDDRGRDEEPAVDVHHRPRRSAGPEHDRHHHAADGQRRQRLEQQLAALGRALDLRGVDVGRRVGRRRRGRPRTRQPRWRPRSRCGRSAPGRIERWRARWRG